MFTIKHIDDYGNETIFSAKNVRVQRNVAEGDMPGVIVEGVIDQDFTGAHYPIRVPGEARATTGFEAAIFVMNEGGATIANYRL